MGPTRDPVLGRSRAERSVRTWRKREDSTTGDVTYLKAARIGQTRTHQARASGAWRQRNGQVAGDVTEHEAAPRACIRTAQFLDQDSADPLRVFSWPWSTRTIWKACSCIGKFARIHFPRPEGVRLLYQPE